MDGWMISEDGTVYGIQLVSENMAEVYKDNQPSHKTTDGIIELWKTNLTKRFGRVVNRESSCGCKYQVRIYGSNMEPLQTHTCEECKRKTESERSKWWQFWA